MMHTWYFRLSLKNKLSLILISSVIVLISVLGVYFDTFLRDNHATTAKERITYAFHRIFLNLSSIESDLKKGIAFIKDDEAMLASIDLINIYQDKDNYDALLLDEEKKQIAEQLLYRVKLSLNDDIALYDRNGELIAYVVKTQKGYVLNFISYENGHPLLYSRTEHQSDYHSRPFNEMLLLPYRHITYYVDSEVAQRGVITHHTTRDGKLIIKSHQNLLDGSRRKVTAHIELSRNIGPAYFKELSEDLNMAISGKSGSAGQKAANLLEKESVEIAENSRNYFGTSAIPSQNGPYFITAALDKSSLTGILNENRQVFIALIAVMSLIALAILSFLFNRTIARPLQALMMQIERIRQQDYSTPLTIRTGDELETISKNVSELARNIYERENALRSSQRQLEHLSNTDPLTNLPNRRLFNVLLEHALDLARRNHQRIAVIFLDLDDFKQINDTLGHDIGDELLKEVALRLRESLRSSDTLARIGGDEFNILVEGIEERTHIAGLVEKLLGAFKEPFLCNDRLIRTSTSIGIALYPEDGEDSVTLTKHADLAMYKSKSMGRNAYSYFSQDLFETIEKKTRLIHALKTAVDFGNEFFLLYQPKISTRTPHTMAIEALIRWKNPTMGTITPDRFIPVAEESGLIIPIGKWVLEKACRDFLSLKEEGFMFDHISVNVSSIQLQKSDMTVTLAETIAKSGIDPTQLELEITESYIATEQQKALSTLQSLRDMGIRLAIDDFGTGYSSMSYLQKLPVTRLKIDKSFVDDLPGSPEGTAVARAIIALAKTFGLSITAEGVENSEQLAFLTEEGCDEIQGYHYSKPLPIEELKTFVRAFLTHTE